MAASKQKEQQPPIARGEHPHADDWLTDSEMRDRSVARLTTDKMNMNIAARRLAIMQDHRANTDQANAITRNR